MPYKDRARRLEFHRRYNKEMYPAYYASHKEEIQAKTRKYLSNPINRAKQRQKLAVWKKAHPEMVRFNSKNKHHKRRLILKGAGHHTLGQWESLKTSWNNCCAICGMQEPFNQQYAWLTEDHILPISKGGSNGIENIQPLCKSCNSRKHNRIIKS